MGPDDDPMAVVDPQLRVRGVSGLRFADASIMPDVARANANVPTMMIAERAADFIKVGVRRGWRLFGRFPYQFFQDFFHRWDMDLFPAQ